MSVLRLDILSAPVNPLGTKLLVLGAGVAAVAFLKRLFDEAKKLPLPPGPKGHWLYGVDLSKPYLPRVFAEWSKTYGPVFCFKKDGKTFIIICGQQAATDIMEKENGALVDRPRSVAAGEIISGGMRILLVGQGERFRKLRKALQSQLHAKVVEMYEPIQTSNARNVILDILDNPERHQEHAKRYAASVVISLTYGKLTPSSYSDPEVQAVNKCLGRLGRALIPGENLVDSFPFLRYIPGFCRILKMYHKEELALFRSLFDRVRHDMGKGEVQSCFAKYLIEKQAEFDLSDDELAYLAGSMFGAGSDTTASAISIVIMAAALHPHVQKWVQDQIDSIVGKNRVPAFDDMNILTRVNAFYLETFRWRPVSVGGFAHRATKDIIYGSMRIPEGATVIGDHWAIGKDPEVYPEPEKFNPLRWLTENGEVRDDLKFYNFGFGRRVCPGQHVANRSLFINTALLLWAFNISEDPASPIDSLAFTNTANTHPLPFRVKFEPRMDNLRALIEQAI